MLRLGMKYVAVVIAAVVVLASAASAKAMVILEVGMAGNMMTIDTAASGTAVNLGDGTIEWSLDNPMTNGPQGWTLDNMSVTFKTNPTVTVVAGFTNNTASTGNFNISATVISSAAFTDPSIKGFSSINAGDSSAADDDVTLSSVGSTALYEASIGGTVVKELFDGPVSQTDANGVTFGFDSFGPEKTSPTTNLLVSDQVKISHTFSLTAGDQATFNSRFDVVPEPASVALVALGGFCMLGRKRTQRD